MNDDAADVIEAIFAEAVRQPDAAGRTAYVTAACGADARLRARVEALLRAHEDAGSFMAAPGAHGRAADGVTVDAAPGVGAAAAAAPGRATAEQPGARIGRYKLLQSIGEGGFGSVFMAEQERPVRRLVALKLIKLGMDTKQVVARFEAERQALAMMDHPNIARALDAGSTDAGRPYFVMELVRGVPVTQYCDQHNLDTRQRLELFAEVCHAVQHAHTKGVIHRDIKPSNLLVATLDGRPVPKVIDFGIAKALHQGLTEATVFTGLGTAVGTPAYMSPEQADVGLAGTDTRSDVYSLGVVAYELLTGTTPLEGDALRRAGHAETLRLIKESEPPRPSTRIGQAGDALAAISARRGTEPRKLARLLAGDLDWIVMRALEKDRTRRYGSAAALAEDVRRYLDDQPVLARPPGAVYRGRKFVKRHKAGVAAAAAVLGALVLGLIGTAAGLRRATEAKGVAQRAEGEAVRQRVAAERAAERALSVNDFMQGILSKAGAGVAGGGRDVKVLDLLDRAAAEIPQTLAGQPEAEVNARGTLGESYLSLGMPEVAEEHFTRAHLLAAARFGEDSEQALLLATRVVQAALDRGRAPSQHSARRTYEAARSTLGDRHEVSWRAAAALGRILNKAGRFADGEAVIRALGEAADGTTPRPQTQAEALRTLATSLRGRNKLAEAEAVQRDALRLARAGAAASRVQEWQEGRYLGDILEADDRLDEARRVYKAAVDTQARELGPDHPTTNETVDRYVRLLVRLGEFAEAAALRQRQLGGAASGSSGEAARLARLGEVLAEAGRTDDAARAGAGQTYARLFDLLRRLEGHVNLEGYREAAIGVGLGAHHRFASDELRSHAWCLMRDVLFRSPSRVVRLDDAGWRTFRFELTSAGAGKPIGGDLGALRELATPADGLYRLTVRFELDGVEPLRGEAWVPLADWEIALYPAPFPPDRDPEAWRAVVASGKAAEVRRSRALAMASGLTPRPGPGGRTTLFGLVASASLDLPAGRYRVSTMSDDGIAVEVDDRVVIAPWSTLRLGTADVTLGAGRHALRVQYFQAEGAYKTWLRLEPLGE